MGRQRTSYRRGSLNRRDFLKSAVSAGALGAATIAAPQIIQAANTSDAPPSTDVSVADLRCEYLTNPLGIDAQYPRFTWKLVDSKKTRGQKQTAYQIVVTSDSRDGSTTPAALWDSGKVTSRTSVNNVYAGAALRSGQNCHWKVRAWDKDGNATPWSREARFSMGLLEPSDWEGDWIRYEDADNIKHIWYRKTFSLRSVPSLAFVYLGSIGYHELYVNGHRIGTRVLTPEVTNLKKRALYVTYDITDTLKQGDNVIAIWTGPGWAQATGSFGKPVWEQKSVFRCQINMSNGVRLHSDATWKCRISSSENLGLWRGGGKGEYGGETIDARRHIAHWNASSCDDRDWATPHGSEYGGEPAAQLFNNCVYAYDLDVFVRAAGILGKHEDVNTYSARLAELRRRAHKHFFNEDTKTYIDGRQLALAFPLYTGVTPDQEKEAVFKKCVDEITNKTPYLDTGSPGLPILLKYVIEDADRVDLLYHCLTRTECPGYGFFLSSGETTWPEYWKITGEPSRIHTCYTSIAGYFTKGIGGILPDPSRYGMKKFIIKPHLVGDLTYAKTTSGSYYGAIVSNWSRSGNTGEFHIAIPPNTTARVYIPSKDVNDVLESGQPAAKASGVTCLGRDGIYAVFSVGSGEYGFSSSSVPAAK